MSADRQFHKGILVREHKWDRRWRCVVERSQGYHSGLDRDSREFRTKGLLVHLATCLWIHRTQCHT